MNVAGAYTTGSQVVSGTVVQNGFKATLVNSEGAVIATEALGKYDTTCNFGPITLAADSYTVRIVAVDTAGNELGTPVSSAPFTVTPTTSITVPVSVTATLS